MAICKLCNQSIPSTPYRSIPTRVVETIVKSKPLFQRLIGRMRSMRGIKVRKETVYGGMGVSGGLLVAGSLTYLICYANGCSYSEMRAARKLDIVQVSPSALYQEYAMNAEETNKRYNGKAILITTTLGGDFAVNGNGALVVPLVAGVYAQNRQIWMEYDPRRADEIDRSNAFGNMRSEGGPGVPMKNRFVATFTCNGVNLSIPVGDPPKSVPYLYGCRLDTGAEWYYAKQQ